MSSLTLTVTGSTVICCVHDRVKRSVTDLAYDQAHTSAHLCACCENLFCEPTDHHMFCHTCRMPPVHALGGPLPDPVGRA